MPRPCSRRRETLEPLSTASREGPAASREGHHNNSRQTEPRRRRSGPPRACRQQLQSTICTKKEKEKTCVCMANKQGLPSAARLSSSRESAALRFPPCFGNDSRSQVLPANRPLASDALTPQRRVPCRSFALSCFRQKANPQRFLHRTLEGRSRTNEPKRIHRCTAVSGSLLSQPPMFPQFFNILTLLNRSIPGGHNHSGVFSACAVGPAWGRPTLGWSAVPQCKLVFSVCRLIFLLKGEKRSNMVCDCESVSAFRAVCVLPGLTR